MIKTYHIGGMHCAACAASVERVTKRLSFTDSAQVNLVTEKLTLRGEGIDDDAVIAAADPDKKAKMANAALEEYSKGNIVMQPEGSFTKLLATKGIESIGK